MEIQTTEPLAKALVGSIHRGDVEAVRKLLDDNPGTTHARLVDQKQVGRTLLHIATDWPGHFPNVAQTIALLIERGVDPDAPIHCENTQERPLHGAASSDDVIAIDALLDGGADIEAPGAVFTGGAAMSDAVIFAQWNAARRLLERGAKTNLTQSAALGLLDRLTAVVEGETKPPDDHITAGLWHACRGGQLGIAEYLLGHGANLNWLGWDKMTPLDCARKSGNDKLVAWLRERGAKRAIEL